MLRSEIDWYTIDSPRRTKHMPKDPHFTVILPVCHSGQFLQEALRSLKELDFPGEGFEVLVGGNRDDEESQRIVAEEAGYAAVSIRYVPSPFEHKAALLNAACREARGQYWIFTDDDCRFFPDWLERYEEALVVDPLTGMVGGPDVLEEGASGFDRALDYVLHSPLVRGKLSLLPRSRLVKYYPKLFNMGISRRVALDISRSRKREAARSGGTETLCVFDDTLKVHEDVDLGNRIEKSGCKLVFAESVCVKHFRDTDWHSLLIRNFQLGRACRILGVHRLAQTLLALLLLGMGSSLAAALVFGALGGAVFVIPGAYAVMLALSAVHGSLKTHSLGGLLRIPCLLAGLHFSRGIGYLLP
ncbi:MAG: glycosyltransferase family 2 protein [Candidatus Aminicenantaceae bacterium]